MRVLWLGVLMMLGACGPFVYPPGPDVRQPVLSAAAIQAADGTDLALQRWQPEGPARATILAVHGFNDYSRFIEDPAPAFTAAGYQVIAYDQRGFGRTPIRMRWSGTPAYVRDLRVAVDLVRQSAPNQPLYLLAESMGAAVTLVAQAEAPLPVDGLVLVAPAVWGRASMGPIERSALWLFARLVPGFEATAEGTGRNPSDNIEMLRRLGRDPLMITRTRLDAIHGLVDLMDAAQASAPEQHAVPTLILYGLREDVIPPRAVCQFLARLPPHSSIRLARYPSGYHMLLRDRAADRPIGDILAWLGDPRVALPSGHESRIADLACGG